MATAKDPYSLLRQRPEIFAKTYEELWRLPLFSRHVSEQDLKTTTGILSTRSVLRPTKPSGAGSDPLHRSNSSGTAVLNGGVSCDNITHAEFSSLDPALHGTDNISPGGSVFQKFHVPTMPETRNDGEGTVFQQSLIPVAPETEDVLTDVTTDSCGEVPKSLIPMMLLSEHVFLLTLAKRWKEPPLSYYTMVAEKAATLLQRLAEWPTSLAHHPTFAVPNYEEFPTSSFVVEDLLAMDRPLIHYQELGAQDGTRTDTVSAVLEMLFKSHLMQPWCAGQKIISISEIVATDKGMLRCRLDWPAIVQQLGAGFAFEDYRCQHTPEELDKIFPPTSPKSSKSASVHERAQYLDHRGKEPCVASVRSPPGWFGDTQTDFSSLAQAIVHCDGEKLCLFWPATSQNLDWWGLPLMRHTSRLEEALGALEGLEVMHITEPCTFIVPPFCIHAVITFAGSTHTCVSFAHAAHWPMAKEGLEFCKRLLRDPIYPTCSAVELVRKFAREASVWEQAIEPDSAGTAYLAAWLADMAPYTRYPQK
ncbi:hypothetical protein B0H14DRAFT_3476606 [Mycena olivaceomarginata]|nr:hypothetical protein B0H14DRAFT_3476606 [Mycena olivaceomarginata]